MAKQLYYSKLHLKNIEVYLSKLYRICGTFDGEFNLAVWRR